MANEDRNAGIWRGVQLRRSAVADGVLARVPLGSEKATLLLGGCGEVLDRLVERGGQPPDCLRLRDLGASSPSVDLLFARLGVLALGCGGVVHPPSDLGKREALLGDRAVDQLTERELVGWLGGHQWFLRDG